MKFFGLGLVRIFDPACTKPVPHYPPREIDYIELNLEGMAKDGQHPLPMISIVVPSYNQAQYLEQTLLSILNQQYPKLELIVVDGGSSDESVEIIKKYAHRMKWWVSERDGGQANAINKGMQHATGDILAWLNSDDCLMPNALFEAARVFSDNDDVDAIYSHRILIDESGNDIGRWILPAHRDLVLTYVDYIPQETMFWRRSLWLNSGACVDESFEFALDWDLILRFIEAGGRFRRVPCFLGMFRVHATQKTQANIVSKGWVEMDKIRDSTLGNKDRGLIGTHCFRLLQRIALRLYLTKAWLVELLLRSGFRNIPGYLEKKPAKRRAS